MTVCDDMNASQPKIHIESGLRKMILIEIIFPMVLLILGIYHGLMQVLYRAGMIHRSSFLGLEYFQGLTLHGVVNAIVFTTFFAVAFGYAIIRYYLDRPLNMKVAWLSFALMTVGTLLAAAAILSGKATVLYTFYPPLRAHPAFYVGVVLLVVGSWIAFFNWLPPYFAWKREHPGEKVPLAVVGIFAAFIVWLIATTPVAIEVIFLLIPWSMGWVATVNVPLARMLFWFFGHPLVYFWLLPAYVMYYTMLPKLAGGKLFSDFAGRLTFLWLVLYSAPVGIHHQFTEPGISSTWKFVHAFFTMLVAVPSFVTAFTIAASLEHAGRQRGGRGLMGWWTKLPYLDKDRWLFPYLFAGLVIFIFGGVTGVINASYNLDTVVHNTSWLPAHFHQTIAGPVFLSLHRHEFVSGRETHGQKGQVTDVECLGAIHLDARHHDFFHRAVHRRRRWRAASHEHGDELHRSAIASVPPRLGLCQNAWQHRRNNHDDRGADVFHCFLCHAFQQTGKTSRAGADCFRAVSRRARSCSTNFHALAGWRCTPAGDRLCASDYANHP